MIEGEKGGELTDALAFFLLAVALVLIYTLLHFLGGGGICGIALQFWK